VHAVLPSLPGSENNNQTGNRNLRLQESCWINESLFFLGRVIEEINAGQRKQMRLQRLQGQQGGAEGTRGRHSAPDPGQGGAQVQHWTHRVPLQQAHPRAEGHHRRGEPGCHDRLPGECHLHQNWRYHAAACSKAASTPRV